jgi:hypothetical protein
MLIMGAFVCGTQLLVYSLLLALGLYALHDQPWLRDSRHFWLGWPQQQALP